MKEVTLYTDGGCLGNPGPGGYCAILGHDGHEKEIYGGFARTTNNRMELLACIEVLEALKYPCRVRLYSDSRYVVDGIQKGWAAKWRKNGWRRNKTEPAENVDLWSQLLDLCDRHDIEWHWVKGHAGIDGNERCDRVAKAAAEMPDLPRDVNYETGNTRTPPE